MFIIGEKVVYMGNCEYYKKLIPFNIYKIYDNSLSYIVLKNDNQELIYLKFPGNFKYYVFFLTLKNYEKYKKLNRKDKINKLKEIS